MANRNTANAPRPGGPGGPGRGPGGGGGGRHAAIRGGEKPKDLKGTIKKSFAYLGIYKAGLALVMVLAALSSVFRVIGPRLLGNATDVLYKAVENGMLTGDIIVDYNALLKVVIALCTLYVISYVFNIVQSFTTAQISNNITYRMRKDISEKINRLPIGFFDVTSTGDVLSRITNDVDTIGMSLNQSIGMLVSNVTLFVGSLFMMFITNYIMAFTAVMTSILGFMFMSLIMKHSQKHFSRQQRHLGAINGHVEEIYSGHLVVKAFNAQKSSKKDFERINRHLRDSSFKASALSGLMQPFMTFIGNFGYVAVCIVGALLALNGKITFGVIVAFMVYVRLFTNPLSQIAQAFTSMQSTAGSKNDAAVQ